MATLPSGFALVVFLQEYAKRVGTLPFMLHTELFFFILMCFIWLIGIAACANMAFLYVHLDGLKLRHRDIAAIFGTSGNRTGNTEDKCSVYFKEHILNKSLDIISRVSKRKLANKLSKLSPIGFHGIYVLILNHLLVVPIIIAIVVKWCRSQGLITFVLAVALALASLFIHWCSARVGTNIARGYSRGGSALEWAGVPDGCRPEDSLPLFSVD